MTEVTIRGLDMHQRRKFTSHGTILLSALEI